MLLITTKVDCDSCGRMREISPELRWEYKSPLFGQCRGNVVLLDIGYSLKFAGWDIDMYEGRQVTCPDCKLAGRKNA